MPSFDVVSELDLMEVENAVHQVEKEISQRFDFRGGKSTVEFDKGAKTIKILADDDMKLRSIHQLLGQKMAKRSVDLRCMKESKEEAASGNMIRQLVTLKAGLEKEELKEINKAVKESKLKLTSEIQGDIIRVTGKSIDDLQAVMKVLKAKDFGVPLQFTNMRK